MMLLHTYNRFPIVFEQGEGVHLYDAEGKKYLDFAAGIAVFGSGLSITRSLQSGVEGAGGQADPHLQPVL